MYIGEIIKHKYTKTVFESDNNLFCLMTMNPHPVHTNTVYANRAKHGQILVCGTYVFSLVVGLTVNDISFNAIANLGYDKVIHHKPVFVGDTINAESHIMHIEKQKTTEVIQVKTIAYNQDSEMVLSFEREILI